MDHEAPSPPSLRQARDDFGRLVEGIRPRLHRYAARMTGSVVDAEDVVQDALAKAYYLLPTTDVANIEAWLFKIVHNMAIDYVRRHRRGPFEALDDFPLQAQLAPPLENRELATFALSVYLRLTPMQRSCVILKDVIGYSLADISEMLDASVGAVKAALHRGRDNLRTLAASVDSDVPLALEEPEASLLARYVARFNAHDFDSVRAMLADDVRLDLVGRTKAQGALEVGKYFRNYDKTDDWSLSAGFVEGRPAILVFDARDRFSVVYFVLVQWRDEKIAAIRDYRYARHVVVDADIQPTRPV